MGYVGVTARRRAVGARHVLPQRWDPGGPAPVRAYIPELLDDVLAGRINLGLVFDCETDLDHIAEAYGAMDERRAIKSLVRVGAV